MTEKDLYNKYLQALKQKLIKKYDQLGLRASGDYERKLESQVKGNTLTMLGAGHSFFMENGRRSGGFPPTKAIINWIESKPGLPSEFKENKKQFAFLIARKIAKEGVKVPNRFNKGRVISEVVDEFLANDIYDMLEELGAVWAGRLTSDVIEIFKQAA